MRCLKCYQYQYEAKRAADDHRSLYGNISQRPGYHTRWRARKCGRCDGWKVKREDAPNRDRSHQDAFRAQFRA